MKLHAQISSIHIQQAIHYQKKRRNQKITFTFLLTLFTYLLIFNQKFTTWQDLHIYIFDLALFFLLPTIISIILFTTTKDILASYPLQINQLRYIQHKAARRTMLIVQPNPHTPPHLPLHYFTDIHSNQQQRQLKSHYHNTSAQKTAGFIFPFPTNKPPLPNFCYVCGKFSTSPQIICPKCHCPLL